MLASATVAMPPRFVEQADAPATVPPALHRHQLAPWYGGLLTHRQAKQALTGHPPGAFLVRTDGDHVELSHVSRRGGVTSSPIKRTAFRRRWYVACAHWSKRDHVTQRTYASLADLVNEEFLEQRAMWPFQSWRRQNMPHAV